MSRLYNLPIELKTIYGGLKTLMLEGLHHKPAAYVEIVNADETTVTLATCTRFSVTHSRDEILEGFSCTIAKAREWNPRSDDYANLFAIDKRKRIRIFYGQNIGGTVYYVKIFTGIITKKPETYSFGGADRITLSGKSLGYLLQREQGTYVNESFCGTSKELLEYWLGQAGLDYDLSYTDTISLNQIVDYSTALTGFQAFKNILGPDKESFFDIDGKFIYRQIQAFDLLDTEFAYNESNIVNLNRSTNSEKVTTIAEITGSTAGNSITKSASDAMIEKYGRNSLSKNNNWITSYAQAENLADAILDFGKSYENIFDITTLLNPYLTIGSLITIEDSLSNTSLTQVRAFSINHSYAAGQTHKTNLSCYSI